MEESEKDNTIQRRKVMSLEGDVTGLRFRLEKCESDMAIAAAGAGAVASKTAMGAAAPVIVPPPNPDDLKIIEGIGPKIEELCNQQGIWTYEALAATPVERLQEMLDAAGPRFRIATPDTWPRQAELAATGKWEELKEYQDFLSGGRNPGE